MNQVTVEYVDECLGNSSSLRRAAAEVVLPHTYSKSYGNLMLARPLFVDHDQITGFADDLTALFTLLTSLPARCFDGDLQRYCAALGMDERLADLMRLGATGHPELYGRADAYHDGSSFKLLEFNVGSELGGIDAAQVNRAFLNVASFRDFRDHHQLAYIDTAAVLADALRTAAQQVTSSGEPVVALLEGPGGLNEHEHVFVAIQEAMGGHGIDLLLGEIDQVSFRHGKVDAGRRPGRRGVAVLRRRPTARSPGQPGHPGLAHAGPPHRRHSPVHPTRERPVRQQELSCPRTRPASARRVHRRRARTRRPDRAVDTSGGRSQPGPPRRCHRGRPRRALDACRAHREELILKPGVGYGGVGAVLGREVSDHEWSQILVAVKDQDYVVQRIVSPASEPVCNPDNGALEDWRANWGIFTTQAGYAGAFVRALQIDDGSVISYSNAGTRGACVYSYPPRTKARAREESQMKSIERQGSFGHTSW